MRVLWLLPLFAIAGLAADDPFQLLQDIGRNVVQQMNKTANYTCLETLERSFYKNNGFEMAMHGPPAVTAQKNELLYDRLKLDVAVSEGKEIYAWHGSNKFGATEVTDVVRHGPISTGQFIGYLRNVFLVSGVKFTYRGTVTGDGGEQVYRFDFEVPEKVTRYNIQTKTGHAIVPFHGWLTARASDLQISSLEVTPEKLPFDSPILSAKTDLTYQMARISGRDALIPSSFVLQMEDEDHIFTVSKGNYSQCHEFGSESTLHFDAASDSQTGLVPPLPEKALPAGLKLNLELTSDIDDKTAYTGNPIEGVLTDPLQLNGATIPKGAKLTGVITMFQERFAPERNYFVKMEFQHLATPDAIYTLRSLHQPTGREAEELYFLFGGYLPNAVVDDIRNGVIIFDSKHVRLRRGFRGTWRTVAEPSQTASTQH